MSAPLHACGVNAFIVEPYLEVTEKLIRASPGAKVILMTRKWEDWTKAWEHQASCMMPYIITQVLAGYTLCHWLPHGLLWPQFDKYRSFVQVSLTSLFIENCLVYTGLWKTHHDIWPSREPPLKHEMLRNRTAHGEYEGLVRRLVPKEDLFDFDVRSHGWAELAGLLHRAAPARGTPFPRLRTKGFCTAWLARWQAAPAKHAAFYALLASSALLNWVAYRRLLRLLSALVRRLGERAKRA